MPVPTDKEGCLAQGPYPWKQSGEENSWLGHLNSQFHQIPRQHIMLGLNLRSYATDTCNILHTSVISLQAPWRTKHVSTSKNIKNDSEIQVGIESYHAKATKHSN